MGTDGLKRFMAALEVLLEGISQQAQELKGHIAHVKPVLMPAERRLLEELYDSESDGDENQAPKKVYASELSLMELYDEQLARLNLKT
jgi:hypothetical protein